MLKDVLGWKLCSGCAPTRHRHAHLNALVSPPPSCCYCKRRTRERISRASNAFERQNHPFLAPADMHESHARHGRTLHRHGGHTPYTPLVLQRNASTSWIAHLISDKSLHSLRKKGWEGSLPTPTTHSPETSSARLCRAVILWLPAGHNARQARNMRSPCCSNVK